MLSVKVAVGKLGDLEIISLMALSRSYGGVIRGSIMVARDPCEKGLCVEVSGTSASACQCNERDSTLHVSCGRISSFHTCLAAPRLHCPSSARRKGLKSIIKAYATSNPMIRRMPCLLRITTILASSQAHLPGASLPLASSADATLSQCCAFHFPLFCNSTAAPAADPATGR